ncbi:hypothetical protein L2E82_22745 [Cichorium intybus]|uniref:Uncharacterized protein n=1 Tax=Cichorium intybus TaxID=13427 RepID=A0ACB9DYE3_CICIN|nr:hypothetical protein L2E82_22745 [Cichorium intybus]
MNKPTLLSWAVSSCADLLVAKEKERREGEKSAILGERRREELRDRICRWRRKKRKRKWLPERRKKGRKRVVTITLQGTATEPLLGDCGLMIPFRLLVPFCMKNS